MGPVVRGAVGAEGRELEFLVRSMLELRLQVEELRRRLDDERRDGRAGGWVGEVHPAALGSGADRGSGGDRAAQSAGAAEHADADARDDDGGDREGGDRGGAQGHAGNRRKAAEMLDIGERTLYRKLRDYGIAPEELVLSR